MAPSTPELVAQLQLLAANPPADLLSDAALRTQLAAAAKSLSLALEKPEDVVARVLLSQVRLRAHRGWWGPSARAKRVAPSRDHIDCEPR